jgi:hypothetical protein
VIDAKKNWTRVVEWGGLSGFVLALSALFYLPFQLRNEIALDRDLSRTGGLEAAPAPNLPGRLDGNSVGNANNKARKIVVEKWLYVSDKIKTGDISRIPSEEGPPQRTELADPKSGPP